MDAEPEGALAMWRVAQMTQQADVLISYDPNAALAWRVVCGPVKAHGATVTSAIARLYAIWGRRGGGRR